MTTLPRTGPTLCPPLAWTLLSDGIPPSLLIDLIDPQGMKNALAQELLILDVDRALAPVVAKWIKRGA